MSLTSQDIARIANLARLELKPEESERMLTQINGFFGIVQAMQAVDTTGIEPMAHPVAAIQDITKQTSQGAGNTAESVGNLAKLAADLRRSVANFKLPG